MASGQEVRDKAGKIIDYKWWEGHEVRILDLRRLLKDFKGCLLEVHVGPSQIEV